MFTKHDLRRQAQLARQRLSPVEKDELSRRIVARVLSLPQYAYATTVLWFMGVRNEVRTKQVVAAELSSGGKRVAIPWCEGESLQLFHLQAISDLVRGAYGILEPRPDLRQLASRRVSPGEIEVTVVPGVAFDQQGNRLGHGAGYYDRLLAELSASACLIGVAYECQMLEAIPHEPHDIGMDLVVTEAEIYLGKRAGVHRKSTVE